MKKMFFEFEETVTYRHSVEVELPEGMEEDFGEAYCEIAEGIENREYYSPKSIAAEFSKRFGSENTTFCEDASPSVVLELF